MKRRAISFVTVLALCLSLCPMRAQANYDVSKVFNLTDNMTDTVTYSVTLPLLFDAHGYSYTITGQTAISVKSTGRLYLTAGTIESTGGAGIEVQTGGGLYIDVSGATVIGTTYGLDVSSGAVVQLSGGTFTGGVSAVQTADNDYGALLASAGDVRYAFFDEYGDPIPLNEMAGVKTAAVNRCTNHVYQYMAVPGIPAHGETCVYCLAKVDAAPCTLHFDGEGHAECPDCGRSIDVTVGIAEAELVYDSTPRPDNVTVGVVLGDGTGGKTLDQGSDFNVQYTTGIHAGDAVEVTVAGIGYDWSFTKTFQVTRAQPVLTWADPIRRVDYDGSPVEESDLPEVNISGVVPQDLDGFPPFSYAYKKTGDADFTDGLPTEAGTYEIKASLPAQDDYHAAETAPCLELTIGKITALLTPPTAAELVYNGREQELVTGGTIRAGAVGAKLEYSSESSEGPWSEDVPTGINAGDYQVWYRVLGTDDYDGAAGGPIDVTIERKPIDPVVQLEYVTCVYDGGYHQPGVTVIDPEDRTVLPDSEYQVTYWDNQAAGTAKVTVSDRAGGNYEIKVPEHPQPEPPADSGIPAGVVETFEITPADQAGLTITGQPGQVVYGDVFTLGTSGGSGNGVVTWKITAATKDDGTDVTGNPGEIDQIAVINEASGQVKVTGVGTVTVQATKSGTVNDGNHADATAQWTFTAVPKRVAAVVTADNKVYDGSAAAVVHAEVPAQDIVSGDTITIDMSGAVCTFSDANAGTGKSVTVSGLIAVKVNGTPLTGASGEKYVVALPGTPFTVTADITRAETAVTAPTAATPTYTRAEQELLSGAAVPSTKTPVVTGDDAVQVEYSLSKDGPYSTNYQSPKAKDAGSYEVWYRVKESGNYLGTAAEKVIVTIKPKPVSSPDIVLSPDPAANSAYYVYDGSEKKPAVTAVMDGSDTIPASEYTVTYRDNVNVGSSAAVIITDNAGGNYEVSGSKSFAITQGQAVLTGTPRANDLTYNGQAQDLVSVGTASGGQLMYSLGDENRYQDTVPAETNAGQYIVYYKVKGDGNHLDSSSAYVYVTIKPKTVTSPVIQFAVGNGQPQDSYSVGYSGEYHTPSVIVKDGNDTIAGPNDSGPEYTVAYSDNMDAGTATVRIIDNNGGNYIVNGSKTFTITKAKAKFADGQSPSAKTLTYSGEAQALVTPGEPVGGTVVYSLNGGAFSSEIPTGTTAGASYSVKAKVLGDKNHDDSDEIGPISVTIGKKTLTDPDIELSSTRFRYNGSEQKPTVTVKDEKGNVLPASEYTVTYTGDTVKVGTYTGTIDSRGNNYDFTFTDSTKSTFTVTITAADQETLTITGKPSVVYYGDTIQLSTEGGSGNGTVAWTIEASNPAGIVSPGGSDGQFVVNGVGDATIKAVRTPAEGSGYAAIEDTWTFHAYPKPVTAAVTAANKVYDGTATAALTITVPGTALSVSGVTGTFDQADVGTGRTVSIASGSAAVAGTDSDKYAVSFPAATTASITPATPTVAGVAANPALAEYTGEPQKLVTAGSVSGVTGQSGDEVGKVVYSLDGSSYGLSVPTGTNAGSYTVWYKVTAGGNYQDSAPQLAEVIIGQKTVRADELTVTCSPSVFPHDGTQKTPHITVKYGAKEIPADEYTVTFADEVRTATGSYAFTITARADGNYKFDGSVTESFTITEADQAPLSIVVSRSLNVSYGDTFQLSTVGGSGTGAVKWESSDSSVAKIDPNTGVVTVVKGAGSFTVTAQKEGTAGSYGQSNTDSVTFAAKLKQITPVITVADKSYDKTNTAAVQVSWKSGDLVDNDNITASSSAGGPPTGTFSSADAGTNRQVTVDVVFTGYEDKYEIVLPTLITGSIFKVDAKLDTVPQAKTGLVYDGSSQTLLDGGTTVGDIGTVEYSLNEKGSYSTAVPTGVDAGTYTVWYRVAESVNWTGVGPVAVEVTIAPKTVSSVTWGWSSGKPVPIVTDNGGSVIPDSEYTYLASEIDGTFTVTITLSDNYVFADGKTEKTFDNVTAPTGDDPGETPEDPDGDSTSGDTSGGSGTGTGSGASGSGTGSGTSGTGSNTGNGTSGSTGSGDGTGASTTAGSNTGSASIQTSVRNGTASAVVSAAAGNELVKKAAASQSEAVIIKPEIAGDVTKAVVSIPGSTISRLGNETSAALTVSTPVADVTIPNESLDPLSSAGSTVSIAAERTENTVVLTLAADGKAIEAVPGGLTMAVPAEGAGPGTVAVLVHEDGTRETIRWSMADDGVVRIPLNGSATVEIVDNSKDFADVPAGSWAADAVAFASAHELFNGTSKTTFSPEVTMSRAMLATVLYNLEGRPEQDLTGDFSDVDGDAWYAAGVSWAAANGITNGYGNGQFGPNDSVTREQFVVMLWRYAGNSAVKKRVLDFADADQASDFALEALYWATENNILNGYGDGQLDPGGLATRAQAAQLLKNFMENS